MFAGVSAAHIAPVSSQGRWSFVHHGIDTAESPFSTAVDEGYLLYLGRIWKPKGVHTAIRVARASGHKLLIAGNIVDHPDDRSLPYWEREIKPQVDGKQIIYVGEVDDARKNELLGGAKALLFPIEWEEPFGLVMLEAMACGTPVIAYRRGAVPEVVTHGVDGFISDDFEGMVEAVKRVETIDRQACRRTVETRFTVDHMVDRYEALYRSILEEN
jgi:glycosyltransferase involved in cell wall biosynthesis